jgi:hypothetical protein
MAGRVLGFIRNRSYGGGCAHIQFVKQTIICQIPGGHPLNGNSLAVANPLTIMADSPTYKEKQVENRREIHLKKR